MSALPNVDPLDASWRIQQGGTDKGHTATGLSRQATQKRRLRHGSKCYDDLGEHSPNPHEHLSLVVSGLLMPPLTPVAVIDEPISTEKLDSVQEEIEVLMSEEEEAPVAEFDFDGGVPLELIGEAVPDEFAHGLPPGFTIDFEGANDAYATDSRTHVHGFERRTLQRAIDKIEPDLDDPEFAYSHCEPRHLPCN